MLDFKKVYLEAKPKVFRYLYYQCGNKSLAEELTQETFYQVFLSRKSFKGNSNEITWVMAVARNVYLKDYNRNRLLSDHEVNVDRLTASSKEEPDSILLTKEAGEEILAILQELPENYRSVIIWREIEGLAFEDIGKLLHKSPSTVRVLLFRAKKRFRELYFKKYT